MDNSWNFDVTALGGLLVAVTSFFPAGAQAKAENCKWVSPAERMIVAELYTSEGCSSCPPADRWLSSQLATPERTANILALSFHVDYWNYIGWQDPYSNKQFTARQYAHKSRGNISQIYTPQYVFSNREVRRWGQAGLIPQRLAAMKQDKAPISLHMSVERKLASQVEIRVKTDWLDDRYKAGKMLVALYEDKLSQQVKSGENRGALLRHDRVVRYLGEPVAVSTGDSTKVFTQSIPADWNLDNIGIGVIVENSESNTVLQALNAPRALARCS